MLSKRFSCAPVALAACLAGVAAGSWAQEPPASSGQAIVTYQNGSLTIKARDVPLADVLHAVGRETGVRLDIPAEPHEQIQADLGPGPAREVLTSLLKGQGLNYAITGSGDDPNGLQVFILPRSHAADAAPTHVVASSGTATPVKGQQTSSPRVVPVEHQTQMKELLAQARAELADLPGAGDSSEGVLDAGMAAKLLNQIEEEYDTVSQGGTPQSYQPPGGATPTRTADSGGNPNPIGGHSGHRPH
jgi:hypothetical protein